MKSKKGFEIAIVVVLVFSSLVAINSKINNKVLNQQEIENYEKLKRSGLWSVPYIDIVNNWTAVNMTYDWCNYRDGYYIIENVSITGMRGRNGVWIENTTENFIIRNCYVDDGVSLIRAQGGQLINNTLFFGQAFYTRTDVRVGVYMTRCNNITLRNNFLNDTFTDYFAAKYGFLMFDCNNITVTNNDLSIFDMTGSGDIIYSEGIAVQEFYGSKNIVIVNNSIRHFGSGISITPQATECKIIGNYILNSKFSGIFIWGNNHLVSNNSIRNYYDSSSFYFMDQGIFVLGSNNTVFWNDIARAEIGIRIRLGGNNNVYNNAIQKTRDHGIYLEESNYNNVTNNIILKSEKFGIYIESSNFSMIIENTISSVYACITEINCDGNIIEDNACIQLLSIFGYNPMLIIGIVIMTTSVFIKFKFKKSKHTIIRT